MSIPEGQLRSDGSEIKHERRGGLDVYGGKMLRILGYWEKVAEDGTARRGERRNA